MPEGALLRSEALHTAQAKVGAWLAQFGGDVRSLDAVDLARYPGRDFASGWQLPVQFLDAVRRMELLLPLGFPWQPPRVALVDRPPFLSWPHIERDGLLCLATNTLSVDPDDPAGVTAAMLGAAEDLINALIAGNHDADFRDEFLSYWDFAADESGPTLLSLLRPIPPTRLIRVWRGKNSYVLAENDAGVGRWLTNRFGKTPDGFQTELGAFFWRSAPLVPREYPSTGQQLLSLAAQVGRDATALLSDIVHRCPSKVVTALGFDTANGPALAAVIMPAPAAPKHGARDPLTKGFRPHGVPDSVLLARYFGGGKTVRRTIERADAAWIHGRGQDARAARLETMHVTVVGCGSIGAAVAIALAQAGIGRILLIDFDILRWANIGRHPLGASCVGQAKSRALAEKLRSEFPHMTVDYQVADIETVLRKNPGALDAGDLIISATGSWAADTRLDSWHIEAGRRTPILYGWMEAHACAGHAVLVGPFEGCLRCGFDNTGLPDFQVTAWPNGTPERQEPACGAVYQPYGPVELGFVNSLIGELALDALLGEERAGAHRVWVGPARRLRHLDGAWNAGWRADALFREDGAFVVSRTWPSTSCAICKKALAA